MIAGEREIRSGNRQRDAAEKKIWREKTILDFRERKEKKRKRKEKKKKELLSSFLNFSFFKFYNFLSPSFSLFPIFFDA